MLTLFRVASWLHRRGVPWLPRLLYLFNRLAFGVVLPPSVRLGRDVVLGYSGLGIVVHARCVIGDRVRISPHVTLGGRSGLPDVPVIEDDVLIGAGGFILGPVRVGRGARVGANAVVTHDVAPGSVVVGIPARPISRRDDEPFAR